MANKKYYWLKLKEDFFRQKEIKKLRKIAGGDTYTIIYLKMLLVAMNNDNKIYFEGVEDDFSEELALELDEESDNVKMTLAFLQSQNLIEMINEDEFVLTQCDSMIGNDKTSTERVRKHRLKKKEEQKKLECNVTCNDNCNTRNVSCNENETLEKEKEIDIEIDIEQQHIKRQIKKELEENKKKEKEDVVVADNEIEKSLAIAEIKKAYMTLDDKDVKKIADTLVSTRGMYDLGYLTEKIELSKKKSNIRNLPGFLISAIIEDFDNESITNFNKNNSDKKLNPKVHNYMGSDNFAKYTEEELEKMILENQKNKFK